MNPQIALKTLAGLRLAVGASSWLTPRAAGRAFRMEPEDNPQAPYLARLFGARDVALAVGSLQAEGEARRSWIAIGLACDVADSLAALLGGRDGSLSPVTAALVFAPAAAAVGLGVVALGDEAPGAAAAAGPA